MKVSIEKFNLWITRHKLFAISAPIIVLLSVYFIASSISAMQGGSKTVPPNGEYNNTLPDQKKELIVKEPNDIYRKSQQDSLAVLREKGLFKNILDTQKENDSLAQILEELNNFSLDGQEDMDNISISSPTNTALDTEYTSKKTEAQEKLEYRNLLMRARDERLSRSQDYSAPYSQVSNDSNGSTISIDVAIYRDQFILPGDRVTLILKQNTTFMGHMFPKNTFVYATSKIQGSRVLLEITNIENVRLALVAKDHQDGMIGLHNDRAGELMQEFNADLQEQAINEVSEMAGEITEMPFAKNTARSFGNFLKKKKYKQRDKILLVNGDRLFLVPKT